MLDVPRKYNWGRQQSGITPLLRNKLTFITPFLAQNDAVCFTKKNTHKFRHFRSFLFYKMKFSSLSLKRHHGLDSWLNAPLNLYYKTLVGNKIVDHSDVFGASPVGAAPTTSSLSV